MLAMYGRNMYWKEREIINRLHCGRKIVYELMIKAYQTDEALLKLNPKIK
jgi:hypothetical protein